MRKKFLQILAFLPTALVINCAYADEIALIKAMVPEPFWIAAGSPDILDPPSVNLTSIAVSAQNPQWRVVNFIDNANVVQRDTQTIGIPVTVDCVSLSVVGGLPQLQPEYWPSYSEGDVDRAFKVQKEFDTNVAKITCRVPLPQRTPQWVDVNKALGETFLPDHEGPYSEYDRNSVYIHPENKDLRTVTARDTYNSYSPHVDYWRHIFDCKNKTTSIDARYYFR